MAPPKITWDENPAPRPGEQRTALADDPRQGFGGALQTYAKTLGDDLTLGGTAGATARGAGAADWMAQMFGGEAEQIPREYPEGSATAAREGAVRRDLAQERAANPNAAGMADVTSGVLHGALATAAAPALGALAVPAIGAGEGLLRAGNANEDPVEGAAKGATTSMAFGVGGKLLSEAPDVLRYLANGARGVQLGGADAGRAARLLDENRAGIRTAADVGAAAEEQGLPGASRLPMGAHSYQQAAEARQAVRGPEIDRLAREGGGEFAPSRPPLRPEEGQTMPVPAVIRDPNALRPPVQGRVSPVDLDSEGETLPVPMIPRQPVSTPQIPPPPAVPREFVPPGAARVSRADIENEIRSLAEKSQFDVSDRGRAYRAALERTQKELQGLPEQLTPAQALQLRRGMDANTRFEPGETVVPGSKEAHGDVGREVRRSLYSAMDETPQGPEFRAANRDYSQLDVLRRLAAMKAAKEGVAGTAKLAGMGAVMGAAGGAGHALSEIAHAVPDAMSAAHGGGYGAAAGALALPLAAKYGPDVAATGFKGLANAAEPLRSLDLPPGANAGILDIWSVQDKQKNATDPAYRQKQRDAASKQEP